jgi:hypothetical protein
VGVVVVVAMFSPDSVEIFPLCYCTSPLERLQELVPSVNFLDAAGTMKVAEIAVGPANPVFSIGFPLSAPSGPGSIACD